MKGLIILTLLSLTFLISCQVNVLGPPNLVSKIKNFSTGPSGGKDI
jgi:hypothetical protein